MRGLPPILQVRYLSKAIGIPAEEIIRDVAVKRRSITITFLVPCQYYHIIIQRSTLLESVWILLELGIIEVAILGFTFNPSVDCFLTLLRGSRPFTADLLGVTEVRLYGRVNVHILYKEDRDTGKSMLLCSTFPVR